MSTSKSPKKRIRKSSISVEVDVDICDILIECSDEDIREEFINRELTLDEDGNNHVIDLSNRSIIEVQKINDFLKTLEP